MLLCLQSDQSSDMFEGNKACSFVCVLPERYELNTNGRGKWFIGLTEITLPIVKSSRKWEAIYVCCQQCEYSVVGQIYKPIVASFSVGEIKRNNFTRFSPVHYVPLKVDNLDQINVEICHSNGEVIEELHNGVKDSVTKCVFDLQWQIGTSPWRP